MKQKHLTVYKKWAQARLKMLLNMCLEIIYLIYTYKKNLALNNLQWFICHKTKPNQTKPSFVDIILEISILLIIIQFPSRK